MRLRPFYTAFIVASLVLTGCGGTQLASDAQSTAEKTVENFYNALKANDTNTALAFVPDDIESTDDFQRTWKEVSTWTFNAVEVVSFEDPYVTVKFDITVEGDQDTGTDQVEVKEMDGKWWIVDVPS